MVFASAAAAAAAVAVINRKAISSGAGYHQWQPATLVVSNGRGRGVGGGEEEMYSTLGI